MNKKIGPDTKIIIYAHGEVLSGNHYVADNIFSHKLTKDLFMELQSYSNYPLNIHLESCYSGIVNKEFEALKRGSFLSLSSNEKVVSLDTRKLFANFTISPSLEGATKESNFQYILDNIPYHAARNSKFIVNGKIFNFDPDYNMLLDKKLINEYIESVAEKFISIIKSNYNIDLKKPNYSEQIIEDYQGIFLNNMCISPDEGFPIFINNNLALLASQKTLLNNNVIGCTALYSSILNNNIEIAKLLIKAGADVEKPENHGVTPLMLACELDNIEIINVLIKAGANINLETNDKSNTALTIAYTVGSEKYEESYDVLKLLIKAGGDLNKAKIYGNTLLSKSIERNKIELIKILIEEGADVNKSDKYSYAPLVTALEQGNIEIIKLLLASGADVNQPNKHGITPFIASIKKENIEIVKLLISFGADVNMSFGVDVNKSFENGGSPLLAAVKTGEIELVKILIEAGANINKDALLMTSYEGHLSILKFFIENGADINDPEVSAALLIAAASQGNINVVELLIEAEVDLNKPNKNGKTALSKASKEGGIKMVKILVEAGANIDNGALAEAALKNHIEIIEYLIGMDKDINKSAKYSDALIKAAQEGNIKIIKLLIKAGCDVNKSENDGTTALSTSSMEGNFFANSYDDRDDLDFIIRSQDKHEKYIKTIKLLLKCGANPIFDGYDKISDPDIITLIDEVKSGEVEFTLNDCMGAIAQRDYMKYDL